MNFHEVGFFPIRQKPDDWTWPVKHSHLLPPFCPLRFPFLLLILRVLLVVVAWFCRMAWWKLPFSCLSGLRAR